MILPLAAVVLAGCSSVQSLSSTALPGTPVINFPNVRERNVTTVLFSNPFTQVAGVNGRAFAVTSLAGAAPTDLLTLDINGNLGINGDVYSSNDTRPQADVAPLRLDALGLLERAKIVSYTLDGDASLIATHYGVAAGSAPAELSGPGRSSLDAKNTVAVELAAIQQLAARVKSLESQVSSLHAQLKGR